MLPFAIRPSSGRARVGIRHFVLAVEDPLIADLSASLEAFGNLVRCAESAGTILRLPAGSAALPGILLTGLALKMGGVGVKGSTRAPACHLRARRLGGV